MTKMYFGAWQNFYHLSWPVRFLIEGILFLLIVFALYKLIKKLGLAFKIKPYLIKGCVWIATEVVYLFGRNNSWAVEADNKVVEWGEKKLNGGINEKALKRRKILKFCVILGIIVLYIVAVFVDLPLSRHLQEEYLTEFASIKDFFQQYEEALSRGYEDYPPLFVKKEPEETVEDPAEEPAGNIEEEEEIPIYIQLNETGKNGSNVRQEPSLNGKVVGGVNGEMEILYMHQWECDDDERYWIKIYVPSEDVEGWLSGRLVDNTQLEALISEPEA